MWVYTACLGDICGQKESAHMLSRMLPAVLYTVKFLWFRSQAHVFYQHLQRNCRRLVTYCLLNRVNSVPTQSPKCKMLKLNQSERAKKFSVPSYLQWQWSRKRWSKFNEKGKSIIAYMYAYIIIRTFNFLYMMFILTTFYVHFPLICVGILLICLLD